MKIATCCTIALFLMQSIPVAAGGHAAPGAQGILKARAAQMTLYSFNLGFIGDMVRGKTAYQAETAAAAANYLAAVAAADQSVIWTEGTDTTAVQGSRALPAIWQNAPDFDARVRQMATAATALSDVAGSGDMAAIGAAVGQVGTACGACHKPYRQPK